MPRHYLTQALCLLAVLLAGCVLIGSFAAALDRPQVHFSWGTQECVRVVDLKAEHEGVKSQWSCDRLPEKYERVWVE
jgi:hypothetical protein